MHGDQIGGKWSTDKTINHINILELKAAFFALQSFFSQTHNTHTQIQIDNITAVSYINNMGGLKSPLLNKLAIEIWECCRKRNIWVFAAHMVRKLDADADCKSRTFSDKNDWMRIKQELVHRNYRVPIA